MNTVPSVVSDYLQSISHSSSTFAFLKLNGAHHVIRSGGALQLCGIPPIDASIPVENQIDLLSGILPVSGLPVVIVNTETENRVFIDLHVFRDGVFQWVLFLDNTEEGITLQAEQQVRLTDDFKNESLKKVGN